jgi:multicomponent Na+:H+ antiporter subunit D
MLYSAFLEAGLAPMTIIIVVATAIALIAWVKVLYGTWLKRPEKPIENVHEFPVVIVPIILAVVCILLGIFAPTIDKVILNPTVSSLRNVDSYIQGAINAIGGA